MQLVTLKATDLLPSTQLILSKCEYEYSQNLSIEKNQHNQLVFSNQTDSDYYGQAYLDFILNPTANYILQIKLEQEPGQDKRFWFGLMSDSDKEITWGWDDEKLSYFEYSGNYGLKTLVKGKSILDYDWSLGNRSLEVRINIQKRMLKVGSLPNYDSVVQADKPETINPATSYRFYFFLTNPRNKMTILKLQTVSQFDDAI